MTPEPFPPPPTSLPTPAPCVVIDVHGFAFPCGVTIQNPCMSGGTTLYFIVECKAENPPLAEWCETWPAHPTCVASHLPPTGTGEPVALAGGLLLAGVALLAVSRRVRFPRRVR